MKTICVICHPSTGLSALAKPGPRTPSPSPPLQETASQCHSEPKAKNLVFVSSKKCEMLRSAQHDTCRTFRIARQPPKGEVRLIRSGYTYHSCALSDSLAL